MKPGQLREAAQESIDPAGGGDGKGAGGGGGGDGCAAAATAGGGGTMFGCFFPFSVLLDCVVVPGTHVGLVNLASLVQALVLP